MKSILKYKNQYFFIISLVSVSIFIGCKSKQSETFEKEDNVKGVLVTAKYCNRFSPKYGIDGVNIYFAGRIFNNTSDTFYMPDRNLSFFKKNDVPLKETLYYTLINGDSLFFWSWAPAEGVDPNSSVKLKLQYYITPEKPELLSLFKNIDKDHTILDTMKICFATPNMQLEDGKKLLPPIVFDRSTKFRIDTVPYNSYFEGIFKGSDFEENPSKELLESEKLPGL